MSLHAGHAQVVEEELLRSTTKVLSTMFYILHFGAHLQKTQQHADAQPALPVLLRI
jgi:hypothetical protein